MTTFAAAIERRPRQAEGDIGALTLSQIDNIFGWAGDLDGPVLARLLIAQLASDNSDVLVKRCASTILETDIQEALLAEVLTLVPLCRSSIQVASYILRALQPDHLLAHHDLSDAIPFAVYDALDDGLHLFVSKTHVEQLPVIGALGLIVGVDFPLQQIARFRVAGDEEEAIYLEVCDEAPWLEREQAPCPPFIVVI